MTNVVPLSGQPRPVQVVAQRVLDDLDGVVTRMGEAYRQDVPEYAALEARVMATEVLPVSRRLVEAFFWPILAGREPDIGVVTELTDMGRRRLEMGVPLEPMLHVYRLAGRVVWDAVVAATGPDEQGALAELGAKWMDFVDRAASVAAAAYLAASHDHLRRLDARRRELLEALLAAADAAEITATAIRFSTVLAHAYVPVLLVGDGAAGRIDSLADGAPDGTIAGPRGSGVLLLLPAPAGRVELERIGRRAFGGLITFGRAAAPGPALAREVASIESLMLAARAAGVTSGRFGPEDLLLEQLLAGTPAAADALRRRVLGALEGKDHGGLITSTLRTFLGAGSVPETARRENVHANTVSYRLRRVAELTGLDPRVPAESALLVLALIPRAAPGGEES
ncbi:MAG TPA: helix-turn-helix domain-containing protein [Acidimicrobiales bacterium]|nr:helix-turn-helix domain-containing protein [Acidimicrobiales bacterium]